MRPCFRDRSTWSFVRLWKQRQKQSLRRNSKRIGGRKKRRNGTSLRKRAKMLMAQRWYQKLKIWRWEMKDMLKMVSSQFLVKMVTWDYRLNLGLQHHKCGSEKCPKMAGLRRWESNLEMNYWCCRSNPWRSSRFGVAPDFFDFVSK